MIQDGGIKMTKTLTEQWRDGTLKIGSYYIRIITGIEKSDFFEGKKFCFWTDYEVEEVLSPVPSYNEWKQAKENLDKNGIWYTERSYKLIEKKLAIAVEALKDYENKQMWIDEDLDYSCAEWALQRIEELDK